MMADETRPVTGGVDTHKDVHVAALVDDLGGLIATRSFANRADGHRELLSWMTDGAPLARVGVEGTSSYGAGLSRHLVAASIEVVEVNQPDRAARRRAGKSDPVDALAAARAALSGRHAGTPKAGDGAVESIRMLRLCRRSAVQSRTQTLNQVHTLVDTAPQALHDAWAPETLANLLETALTSEPDAAQLASPAHAATYSLGVLAQRWKSLTEQIDDLDTELTQLVTATAPALAASYGFGTDTTGALLVAAGDNPHRLRSDASFAALCGVAPVPASSGRTTRHRLNRGGNRDANRALWVVAMVRMSHHQPTRAYVERRTSDGLSKREIIRCLKRYIAREAYKHLKHLDT